MALGKVLGGSWASNGPLQGLGKLLGSSWRVLVGLLRGSWEALGPSCGSRSIHDIFMKPQE